MGKIIAIANQKGGVGKTTTSINLGSALSSSGKKVLLIDLDEQANATIGLGFSRELIDKSTYELLTNAISIEDTILTGADKNLDIIPSSIKLADIEATLHDAEKKEYILFEKIKEIADKYDYFIIDCPPSLGVIIDNALFASDSVVIPVECEYYAYDALTQMVNKINEIQKQKRKMKSSLTIEGILMTKLDNQIGRAHV